MDTPTCISIPVIQNKRGIYADADTFLSALKPLALSDGLVIPKNTCFVGVKQLRAWLKLTDPMYPLSIMLMPKTLGMKNGRSYAQFKSCMYYYGGKNIRGTLYTHFVKLQLERRLI